MLITRAEFARRMKVSPMAVTKAVQSGRLTLADGKHLDDQVAKMQWELNRQRMPPIRPAQPIAPGVNSESPDFDLDADAIWITMIWNQPALPDLVRHWLNRYSDQSTPPLVAALVKLLRHFAENINRIRNPEED